MGPGIKGAAARARQRVDQDSRAFNVALWRIATGKPGPGGVVRELSTVTGCSECAIQSRLRETADYPPAPIVPGANLTADDLDYFGAIYRPEGDPVARHFLGGLNSVNRRRPDHEDRRVARQRVGGKLISIAIDRPDN